MPTLFYHTIVAQLSTSGDIHISTLGTKVHINWKLEFLAIHQIVWAEPRSYTSSTIIHMH